VASPLRFAKGTLRGRLAATAAAAFASGSLQPIPTSFEIVDDGGIPFLVRVLGSLVRKDEERRRREEEQAETGREHNPFLPYEEDLFVSDLTGSHIALLNKFNVIAEHLLVVTRNFVHQDEYPDLPDFEALLAAMAEYESLGFYNGGTVAGASQSHKHLQLVPLPFKKGGEGAPIGAAIADAGWQGATGSSHRLPFLHALGRVKDGWFEDPAQGAPAILDRFHALLEAVKMEERAPLPGQRHSRPYNLLVTRRWMLLVPRSRECFEGASVNALGFAGALLVRSAAEMEQLKQKGPLQVLASVSFPPESPVGGQ